MDVFGIVLICLIVFYGIAEIFGRSKHIGRGWSFALLATSLVFGIIAVIVSPSAKKEPTTGNQNHKIFGWISIGLGVLNIIALNPLALGLIVLGIYLIQLSKSEIRNNNPKFYFETNQNETNSIKQKLTNNLNLQKQTPNSDVEYVYYIIENDEQSEPLNLNDLKQRKITENTYVWRKGLSDWTKAGEVIELKNILIYNPPPFNPNKSSDTVKNNPPLNKNYLINNKPYSISDIKKEFEKGNYFIEKKTIITDTDGSQKLLTEIPELSFLLDYFPPDINTNNENV